MATKRKINPLQSQVSLKRTKQYEAKTPYTKQPYDRTPREYAPRSYNEAATMIPLSAKYPRETGGWAVGSWVHDYFKRNNDKVMMKRRREMGDSLERALAAYQAANDPYSAVRIPTSSAEAEADNANVEKVQNVQAAADQARAAAQTAITTGDAPVTAAGVSALGLTPQDEVKYAVNRSKAQAYLEHGANPTNAKIEQEKLTKAATEYSKNNMALMPYEDLVKLIDEQAQQHGKHISSDRVKMNKQYWLDQWNRKRINDTLSLAKESAMQYRMATPEQRKQMLPQMYDLQHRLGSDEAFAPAIDILNEPMKEEAALAQAVQLEQARFQNAMRKEYLKAELKGIYGGRSNVNDGGESNGRNRNNPKKTNKGQYELGKEALMKTLKDNTTLISSTPAEEEETLKKLKAKQSDLIRRINDYDINYSRAMEGSNYAGKETDNDRKYNAVLQQARAWVDLGFTRDQVAQMVQQYYGEDAPWYMSNIDHDIYENDLYK